MRACIRRGRVGEGGATKIGLKKGQVEELAHAGQGRRAPTHLVYLCAGRCSHPTPDRATETASKRGLACEQARKALARAGRTHATCVPRCHCACLPAHCNRARSHYPSPAPACFLISSARPPLEPSHRQPLRSLLQQARYCGNEGRCKTSRHLAWPAHVLMQMTTSRKPPFGLAAHGRSCVCACSCAHALMSGQVTKMMDRNNACVLMACAHARAHYLRHARAHYAHTTLGRSGAEPRRMLPLVSASEKPGL